MTLVTAVNLQKTVPHRGVYLFSEAGQTLYAMEPSGSALRSGWGSLKSRSGHADISCNRTDNNNASATL
jgi:hypothetical protein